MRLDRASTAEDRTDAIAVRRGITRITVTVVVIMFELTGALTYILPTMVRLPGGKHLSHQLQTDHARH